MMENQLKIKASNIQNLSDARYFAAVGAEFIGFNFNPESSFYVTPTKAKEIIGWLSGPKYYGTFENVESDEIIAIVTDVKLNAVEFYQTNPININGIETILRVNNNEEINLKSNYLCIEIDDLTQKVNTQEKPFFIAYNNDLTNYKSFIEKNNPLGIEIQGEIEEKVGLKSFDNMEKLVDLVEEINEE